jgi:hypothetical protein
MSLPKRPGEIVHLPGPLIIRRCGYHEAYLSHFMMPKGKDRDPFMMMVRVC